MNDYQLVCLENWLEAREALAQTPFGPGRNRENQVSELEYCRETLLSAFVDE